MSPAELPADTQRDESFMRCALDAAREAAALGEVPVGAVVVKDGAVVSAAYNRRETGRSALLHAEIAALGAACEALNTWRLTGCTLYVTLEPCPMCAGAAINARVDAVVFAARDPKAGACGSVVDLFALPFNHHPAVREGVLAGESAALLKGFFRGLRSARVNGADKQINR